MSAPARLPAITMGPRNIAPRSAKKRSSGRIRLVFRGVAFEFRFKHAALRRLWDGAFCAGSVVATFAQGIVLGAFIQGFKVDGRQFAGSSFDWLAPFPLATGLALMFGYALLGACWLILKTEG